jgi:hypothetical protein
MMMFLIDGKSYKWSFSEFDLGFIISFILIIYFVYINGLSKITNKDSKVALFADDISIIVTTSNEGFRTV